MAKYNNYIGVFFKLKQNLDNRYLDLPFDFMNYFFESFDYSKDKFKEEVEHIIDDNN